MNTPDDLDALRWRAWKGAHWNTKDQILYSIIGPEKYTWDEILDYYIEYGAEATCVKCYPSINNYFENRS